MVKTKEEIMGALRTIIGDGADDTVLELLEDIDDTLSVDNSAAVQELEEWKTKYDTLDADWRKRYRDRFYGDVDETEDKIFEEDKMEKSPLTYDSLFTND
jgi:hypothetical protein